MNSDIYPTIVQILVDKFHLDASRIRPDAALEELGLDSLTLMEFVFAIEDQFHLRIPEDRLDPREGGITLAHMSDVIRDFLAETGTPKPSTP
ncbi:MAG: acyl carrier protein [Curvibacter sp.]|nr:acyl carrier protein [Curvibacter sp.]